MPRQTSIAVPIEGVAWVDGERVMFRLRRGREQITVDMPPQAAVQLSNELHRAAREAKQRTNLRTVRHS